MTATISPYEKEILLQTNCRKAAVEFIKYESSDELVSSDNIGSIAPAIFDSKATQVRSNGKNAILYIWYDNEYGYSQQVMRLAKYVAGVRRFTYH